MEEIRPNQVPERIGADDLTKLQLGPHEAFLLSQIDGKVTVEELGLVTGMSEDKVRRELAKFISMELVLIKEDRPSVGNKAGRPASTTRNKKNGKELNLEDKVRELYIIIDNIDYYSLLGVERDASAKDVKAAYHQLTREYHPDRLFRSGSPEVRDRLQYIFATINKAYKTLSNKKLRAGHDESLGDSDSGVDYSWAHAESRAASRPETEAKTETREPTPPPPPSKPVPPKKPRKPYTPSPLNPFLETVQQAKRIYEGALSEIKRKNYATAKQNLRIAMTLDKFNKVYPGTLRKIESMESKEKSTQHFQSAREMEKAGQFDDAIKQYKEATLLDMENTKYYTRWARILIEEKKEVNQAKTIIKKAFDLGGKDPEQYLVMGLVMKEQGQRQAAIGQFEQGLKTSPKNKELQKALKRIKKGK